jgi:hypothetical protein
MSCNCRKTYGFGVCENVTRSQPFHNRCENCCSKPSCIPEFSSSGNLGISTNPPISRPPNITPGDPAFPTGEQEYLNTGDNDKKDTLEADKKSDNTTRNAIAIGVALMLTTVLIVSLSKDKS